VSCPRRSWQVACSNMTTLHSIVFDDSSKRNNGRNSTCPDHNGQWQQNSLPRTHYHAISPDSELALYFELVSLIRFLHLIRGINSLPS